MFHLIVEFLKNGSNLIIYTVALPVFCGFLLWLLKKQYILKLVIAALSPAACLVFAIGLYFHGEFFVRIPYAPYEFEFLFRSYKLSAMLVLIASAVFMGAGIYTVVSGREHRKSGLRLFYLYISFALLNGAFLSDNLGALLFFMGGLLLPLCVMLLTGNENEPEIALRALTLAGFSYLLIMLGIILTTHFTGVFNISEMEKPSINGYGLPGFICLAAGVLFLVFSAVSLKKRIKPDPYKLLVAAVGGFSDICVKLEHGLSWIYDKGVPGVIKGSGMALHRFDNGRMSRYLYLAVGGLAFITLIFILR